AVDDSWLCDYGRYSFPNFQRESMERPRVRRDGRLEEVAYEDAIAFTVDALKRAGGQAAGWASPADTNEELVLFRRLFREVLRSPHLDHRGAKDLGILPHLGPGYASLNGQAGKGRTEWPGAGLRALYVHESSPLHGFTPSDAESMWLPTLPLIVFHRFKPSPLDEMAHVILPGHAFTEKD